MKIMTNLDRIRKQLSPERRKKIGARAATIIAEFPNQRPVTLTGIAALDSGQGSRESR
ncbi:MAG: hypothetical protein NTV05_11750 [Acidobacteria bacterium]|nr:hypothetical protein [Acidobacteriota bacterium]